MEVIESLEEIFLIHEYCAGGEVLDRVAKKTKYNERVASRILRQILEGLQVLHTKVCSTLRRKHMINKRPFL